MKLLHTADWHLGARLYRESRELEQQAFLDDLIDIIEREGVEALLIAGDVFDQAYPSLAAQALYYRFLARLPHTCCRHTVIIAGNHDSASFLALPEPLLKALQIHVITEAHHGLLPLYDKAGQLELILAPIPYLRERDLRCVQAGEGYQASEEALLTAIAAHYQKLHDEALALRGTANIPIIAMGHLFSSGARLSDDEAIRDLYVGKLGHVPASALGQHWDYVALGHIHRPQKLQANCPIYYSGSPIPLSFGEAEYEKSLLLLHSEGQKISVEALPLPCYQALRRIKSASLADLKASIEACADTGEWLEVHDLGQEIHADLFDECQALLNGRASKILRLLVPKMQEALLDTRHASRLQDLEPEAVFQILLQQKQIDSVQSAQFQRQFKEIIHQLAESASE